MIDLRPDFLDTLKRLLAEIVPDCEVRIFGSRYNWTATDASDLDLALVGPGKLHWKTLARLKAALEESSLPCRVDVLDWRAISPEFQKVIEQGYEVIQKPGLARSSKGWKRYVFSDFVNINPSVRLDSSKDYSFVEMKDLNEKSKLVYPSAKRKPSGGSRFQNNDTLFARITPCLENGKICQVKELENGVGFGSTEFLIFRGKENISDNDFIFYLSRSDEVRRFAEQNMLGTSGRQRVTWVAFNNLELDLPPLPAQRRIAGILSALDDKIELNRQTNATLESLARTLFKSWFVDFDPVRAKADGCTPGGMGAEAAELFPNKFIDTELGEIPASWEIKSIGEIAERVAMGPFGSSIKVETFADEGIPIISGQHLRGFMLEDSTYNFITLEHAEKLNKANVYPGDVIFTHAGNIGNLAFIPEDSAYPRYVVSQRQFFMRCNLAKITPSFITYYFQSPEGQHKLLANTSSVGVPSIAQPVTYLKSIKLPIPPRVILEAFEQIVTPLHRKYRANNLESRTLATLRDALLPKLMSGKIEV